MARTIYPVNQGDHLASIAEDQGYASFVTIWNHADNVSLRQRRTTPQILLPGDEVVIPEKNVATFQRPTGANHTFTVTLPPLHLRAKVIDYFDKPLANAAGTLTFDSGSQDVTTDGDGVLDVVVPYDTKNATLTFPGEQGAPDKVFTLVVGHLDPVDEPSGQEARLLGLGFFQDQVIESAEFAERKKEVETSLTLAWELFQDANGLDVTGKPDKASVDKLLEVYGC
jgi:N-acetylmuramoyl-L-alanine amidase